MFPGSVSHPRQPFFNASCLAIDDTFCFSVMFRCSTVRGLGTWNHRHCWVDGAWLRYRTENHPVSMAWPSALDAIIGERAPIEQVIIPSLLTLTAICTGHPRTFHRRKADGSRQAPQQFRCSPSPLDPPLVRSPASARMGSCS